MLSFSLLDACCNSKKCWPSQFDLNKVLAPGSFCESEMFISYIVTLTVVEVVREVTTQELCPTELAVFLINN